MKLSPYLVFNGQCEEAFKFYETCMGGKIEGLFTYASSPAAGMVPPECGSKVMHARLSLEGQVLMACDSPPDHYKEPTGFSVSLEMKDPADAERIFNALAENGKVQMPLQKTFWSASFGMVVDRFGIPWMINCEQPA